MSGLCDVIMEYGLSGASLRRDYFHEYASAMDETAKRMARCILAGGKILVCGNGGSAADAQHFAAVGNDYGYDDVFARQVEALGREGDMLVAVSTSGGSRNVLLAMDKAHELGMSVVGLCGKSGGDMKEKSDMLFHVPSNYTPFIQEMHEATMHVLCLVLDKYLFEYRSDIEA